MNEVHSVLKQSNNYRPNVFNRVTPIFTQKTEKTMLFKVRPGQNWRCRPYSYTWRSIREFGAK
jgi:hypothetical protein